ncbi:hypothetical protein ACHHYP_07483 [Achlya hypogyna]|uniref:CUE domain-containing protein n=1 Tax=Achlya hypogyna TaxID=1202772 RepID=A0A1V9ZM87_ACHHY|nr:hypothetical protein ACHHYP_07483 [Achlya hypogyna]
MTDAALLSLTDDAFLRCFTTDAKVSDWVFREMKDLTRKVATKQALPAGLASNLLTIVARVVAAKDAPLDRLAQQGIFSVPRLLVMCSLYAESNVQVMQWCLEQLFTRAPALKAQFVTLHSIFFQALTDLHQRSNMLKEYDEDAAEATEQLVDLAQSLGALAACSPTFLVTLTSAGQPLDLAFNGNTLLFAALVAYECDLPALERLAAGKPNVQAALGKARHCFITLLDHWLEATVLSELRSRSPRAHELCESLFAIVDALLHGNSASATITETGSFLSDYNQCYGFTAACAQAFEGAGIDAARADYLEMIVQSLPVREKATAPPPSPLATAPVTSTVIAQVREVFPDLGDGFLTLCIEACNGHAEQVIMALLEDALPPAVAGIDRQLKTTDDAYVARTAPKATVDATQAWVGKKKQAATYRPESAKEDAVTAAKTQALIMAYDEEPPLWQDPPVGNEYNDDYNDELEEYEPFGVDEPSDYEEIKARNKLVRAQEAEDAYWESIRNRNHAPPKTSDDDGDEEEKPPAPAPARKGAPAKGESAKAKGEDRTASDDPKKQMINRARKEANKAKVGNHHRKDAARRKQAKGMV